MQNMQKIRTRTKRGRGQIRAEMGGGGKPAGHGQLEMKKGRVVQSEDFGEKREEESQGGRKGAFKSTR